ncbi:unnamed protein product, partial [Medioppia subpectinata]
MFLWLIFVTKLGPNLMRDRKPFVLREIIMFYNFILVVINAYFTYKAFEWLEFGRKSWDPKQPERNKWSDKEIAEIPDKVVYFYSKLIDLFDTVFFVLRKKSNQITFLHVYHHFMVPVLMYITSKLCVRSSVFEITHSYVILSIVGIWTPNTALFMVEEIYHTIAFAFFGYCIINGLLYGDCSGYPIALQLADLINPVAIGLEKFSYHGTKEQTNMCPKKGLIGLSVAAVIEPRCGGGAGGLSGRQSAYDYQFGQNGQSFGGGLGRVGWFSGGGGVQSGFGGSALTSGISQRVRNQLSSTSVGQLLGGVTTGAHNCVNGHQSTGAEIAGQFKGSLDLAHNEGRQRVADTFNGHPIVAIIGGQSGHSTGGQSGSASDWSSQLSSGSQNSGHKSDGFNYGSVAAIHGLNTGVMSGGLGGIGVNYYGLKDWQNHGMGTTGQQHSTQVVDNTNTGSTAGYVSVTTGTATTTGKDISSDIKGHICGTVGSVGGIIGGQSGHSTGGNNKWSSEWSSQSSGAHNSDHKSGSNSETVITGQMGGIGTIGRQQSQTQIAGQTNTGSVGGHMSVNTGTATTSGEDFLGDMNGHVYGITTGQTVAHKSDSSDSSSWSSTSSSSPSSSGSQTTGLSGVSGYVSGAKTGVISGDLNVNALNGGQCGGHLSGSSLGYNYRR